MAEANWYYAAGDTQKGPVSKEELKTMLASGKLDPNERVWQEGMSDWTSANQVPGLVAAPAVAPKITAKPPSRTSALDFTIEPLKYGRMVGQPLLLAGLVLVLLAKGCDGIGNRNVARLAAKQSMAQNQFKDEWDAKKLEIDEQRREIREKESLSDSERQERNEKLDEEEEKMNKERNEEQRKLGNGDWRDLGIAARDAADNNSMWAYWREMIFVLGSMLFSVGLLGVGFTGQGAERWICLIMLAIVTFSLYVGGIAWISSAMMMIR